MLFCTLGIEGFHLLTSALWYNYAKQQWLHFCFFVFFLIIPLKWLSYISLFHGYPQFYHKVVSDCQRWPLHGTTKTLKIVYFNNKGQRVFDHCSFVIAPTDRALPISHKYSFLPENCTSELLSFLNPMRKPHRKRRENKSIQTKLQQRDNKNQHLLRMLKI